MLWFYLRGAAILIGGQTNSEIENAAAEAGRPDAKERGEKSPGEKEAVGSGAAQQNRGQADKEKSRAKTTTATARAAEVKKASTPSSYQARNNQNVRQGSSSDERKITVEKVVVVAFAWLLSKLRRRQ